MKHLILIGFLGCGLLVVAHGLDPRLGLPESMVINGCPADVLLDLVRSINQYRQRFSLDAPFMLSEDMTFVIWYIGGWKLYNRTTDDSRTIEVEPTEPSEPEESDELEPTEPDDEEPTEPDELEPTEPDDEEPTEPTEPDYEETTEPDYPDETTTDPTETEEPDEPETTEPDCADETTTDPTETEEPDEPETTEPDYPDETTTEPYFAMTTEDLCTTHPAVTTENLQKTTKPVPSEPTEPASNPTQLPAGNSTQKPTSTKTTILATTQTSTQTPIRTQTTTKIPSTFLPDSTITENVDKTTVRTTKNVPSTKVPSTDRPTVTKRQTSNPTQAPTFPSTQIHQSTTLMVPTKIVPKPPTRKPIIPADNNLKLSRSPVKPIHCFRTAHGPKLNFGEWFQMLDQCRMSILSSFKSSTIFKFSVECSSGRIVKTGKHFHLMDIKIKN